MSLIDNYQAVNENEREQRQSNQRELEPGQPELQRRKFVQEQPHGEQEKEAGDEQEPDGEDHADGDQARDRDQGDEPGGQGQGEELLPTPI